jgi:type 1 glutamine amidotransferase
MDGFTFEHIHSLEKIPADVKFFSALVLHYHHKRISAEALARLDDFVKNGGGILAIHSATASFKNSIPYFELLGGRFIGHGKVERIEVKNQNSEIFCDIPNFSVRDELYLHKLSDRIQVHFTTMVEGKDVPVVWTNLHGKGKVCYCVPGHTSGSMKNQIYQQVLQRGLVWVTE